MRDCEKHFAQLPQKKKVIIACVRVCDGGQSYCGCDS